MKYIRKITVFVLIVVFIFAAIISLGVLFAVKNVNITLKSYSCEEDSQKAKETIAELKDGILGDLRGSLIFTVGDKGVKDSVKDSKYVVESYYKEFPCTLNITLLERREVFAMQNNDGSFSVYDENGDYLRKAFTEDQANNDVDGAPNLLIEGVDSDENIKLIASASAYFKSLFQSLRSITEKIEYHAAKSSLESSKLTFCLRSGIRLEIWDCNNNLNEKIEKGFIRFNNLSAIEKLKGSIYCYSNDNDEILSIYNPNA